MFKRTRIRLVLLNALVFFLLLNGFGAAMYVTTKIRLFSAADQMLRLELEGLSPHRLKELLTKREEPKGRAVYVVWSREADQPIQLPDNAFGAEELKQLRAERAAGRSPFTFGSGDLTYRIATSGELPGGVIVQAAYHMEPEHHVLETMLIVITAGGAASLLIAAVAGAFLAGRALVPIQKAWEKQQRFVSDASHELRTPLSVLQLHLERLFRHPERTIEQESGKIAVMLGETERMSRLVADLLTLARSDSNQLQLLKRRVELPALIRKVAGPFRDLADSKGLELTLDLAPDETLTVEGDEERLVQLLVNVLDNAVKYTREGAIVVYCHPRGDHVLIDVRDTGIGISKEDVPHIFDRFFRADKARTRSEGGTGLGLAISKWIVEQHGGTIRADSEPDQGTVVHIVLPRK